ncbi:MAG: hypothetical protein GY803_29175, partial [Chloroflexi bacterium]|nr:hypothetical protein [Chloroflexota bacterium]
MWSLRMIVLAVGGRVWYTAVSPTAFTLTIPKTEATFNSAGGVAVELPPAPLAELAALPQGDALVEGLTLYAQLCTACHGENGEGSTLAVPLDDSDLSGRSAAEIEQIIAEGVADTLMVPWKNNLSTEQIAVLRIMIQQWKQLPENIISTLAETVPATEDSLARGEELFANYCIHCHAADGMETDRAPALTLPDFPPGSGDVALQQLIALGVPRTIMPAWGSIMP